MQAYKCKMCGAGLDPVLGGICTCEYCDTKYYVSKNGNIGLAGEFCNERPQSAISQISFSIKVDDVFMITGRGVVITGEVAYGRVSVGDSVKIIKSRGQRIESTVTAVEKFRRLLDSAEQGDKVGIFLSGVTKAQIERGDYVIKGELDLVTVKEYIAGRYLPTNEKVLAIDFYRKATGLGLKEAKEAVDGIFAKR